MTSNWFVDVCGTLRADNTDPEFLMGMMFSWCDWHIHDYDKKRNSGAVWEFHEAELHSRSKPGLIASIQLGNLHPSSEPTPVTLMIGSVWGSLEHMGDLTVSSISVRQNPSHPDGPQNGPPNFPAFLDSLLWASSPARPSPIEVSIIVSGISTKLIDAKKVSTSITDYGITATAVCLDPGHFAPQGAPIGGSFHHEYRLALPTWNQASVGWIASLIICTYRYNRCENLSVTTRKLTLNAKTP